MKTFITFAFLLFNLTSYAIETPVFTCEPITLGASKVQQYEQMFFNSIDHEMLRIKAISPSAFYSILDKILLNTSRQSNSQFKLELKYCNTLKSVKKSTETGISESRQTAYWNLDFSMNKVIYLSVVEIEKALVDGSKSNLNTLFFHEYLGLMGVSDNDYSLSTFQDLNVKVSDSYFNSVLNGPQSEVFLLAKGGSTLVGGGGDLRAINLKMRLAHDFKNCSLINTANVKISNSVGLYFILNSKTIYANANYFFLDNMTETYYSELLKLLRPNCD